MISSSLNCGISLIEIVAQLYVRVKVQILGVVFLFKHYSWRVDGDGFAFMIIFAVVVIIIIYFSINNRGGKGGSGSTSNFNKYSDIKDDRLKKIGMDADEFKKLAFELYKSIQEEWMNFDYEGLRKHLTDELYNSYVMQLDALKVKGQQNIMKDFENIDVKITNITEEAGIVNVTVYLHTAMYDYVVDYINEISVGEYNLWELF